MPSPSLTVRSTARAERERAPRARATPLEHGAIMLVAVASAIGATAAGPEPTATRASDVVLTLGFGAAMAVAASVVQPRDWIAAALVAAAGARTGWALVASACVVVGAVGVQRTGRPGHRLGGALVGALLAQVVLRLPADRLGTNVLISGVVVACLTIPAWAQLAEPRRAGVRRAALVAAALAGLAVVGILVAVLLARRDVATGIERAQDGLAAARTGEGDEAAERLGAASRAFESAHRDLDAWWARPALLVPVIAQHARSLEILADAGADLSAAAETSARSARLEDLEVTDGRLDLDLVRSMAAPLEEVQVALGRARARATAADSAWLISPVAEGIEEFEQTVGEAIQDASTASVAVDVLPGLLGGNGRRHYFVAFGTPAESRELGGFMGAYGLLQAEDGELTLSDTGRVRDLNVFLQGRQLTEPTTFPAHYLAMLPQRFWHNSTGVADFPTMARAIGDLWPPIGEDEQLDGVLYLDPDTLARLLELTGPIRVPDYDEPLTADTAADFLLREQYLAFPDDDRHDFLLDAATLVFERLTSGDLPGPARIADTLAPAVRERRLLLHSYHPDEQALFARIDADGAMPAVDGDFLSVRASNRGLNKIDALMRRTVIYDVAVDPVSGRVRSTVTVSIANDAPARGLPYAVIGNRLGEPAGTNSTTVAVYTPLDLVKVTQDGRAVGGGATPAHDRNRYIALVDVPPDDVVTVTFHLEGTVDVRHGYHLDVVPQPLVNPDDVRVNVAGTGPWWPWGQRSWAVQLREPVSVSVPYFLVP